MSREAAGQEAVRRRVRASVRGIEAPEGLEGRVRSRLDAADRSRRRMWYAAVAASVLVAGCALSLRLTGFMPHQLLAQEIYIAQVVRGLSPLWTAGVGDHIHCAFYRTFPPEGPSRRLVVEELGEEWAAIEEAVQRHAPEGFEVRLAHRCRRAGREFIHLALLREAELMSLVLTRMRPGEFVAPAPGIASGRADRFAVAGFEVNGYAAFVVSELDEEHNLAAARNWATPLREFLS